LALTCEWPDGHGFYSSSRTGGKHLSPLSWEATGRTLLLGSQRLHCRRENRARLESTKWEKLFPGFYANLEKIPTDQFRIVYTADPIIK